MDDHDILQSARRAVTIERAHRANGVNVWIVGAVVVDEDVAEIAVQSEEPLGGGAWVGGQVARGADDGPPMRGEILEVDADRDVLYVALPAGAPLPEPGPATVWPFDFLSAPSKLLNDEAYADLGPVLADALRGAAGRVAAVPVAGPDALHPAWRHDRVWVWGPPGTGKTHTIVGQVEVLLADPTETVLVVSTTNRATDEVALRLGAKRGPAGLVRLGTTRQPRAYERAGLVSMLPGWEPGRAEAVEAAREALEAATSGPARADAARRLKELTEGTPTLATRGLAPRDRVVFTTLHGALSAVVSETLRTALLAGDPPFTTVVVDEAGLVGRALVAAASLLGWRRLVLVGDPRQLSPIASAARSMPPDVARWLARSGLDHLTEQPAPGVQRLLVQHRMAPQIAATVNALAYGGALRDAPQVVDRPTPVASMRREPRAVWVVLDELGAPGAALHSRPGAGGRSRERPLGLDVVDALLNTHPDLASADVLCVTPYRAQVTAFRAKLRARGLRRWRASTVHAQQGSEADVVLVDTVHVSSSGWPPDEWVRMVNVAVSRARHHVFALASRAEMGQPFLRPMREALCPRVLRRGRWETVEAEPAQVGSLFAVAPAAPRLPFGAVAEPPPPVWAGDDDRIGAQIARRRVARPLLSHEQARLVNRELSDAGPRLVRGVAGSGKTLVLAHWAVRALDGLGVPEVVIVYANKALRGLLTETLVEAWGELRPAKGAMPWHRVKLLHVGELLRDLRSELGLPDPHDRFDYEAQADAVLTAGIDGGRFPALFVDEAQDLGHGTLALLVHLTAPGASGQKPVLIFYDNAQNVYGRRPPVWKALGLDLRGRSDVMKESFRTTRPHVEFALDVLHRLTPLTDDPDLRELISHDPPLLHRDAHGAWHAPFCAVDGEPPEVQVFDDREVEVAAIVARVQTWLGPGGARPGDVRILALQKVGERVLETLREAGVPARELRGEAPGEMGDVVLVTTPHSFKGYEAELVVVAGADAYGLRDRVLTPALYVALTRARTAMLVTAVRGPAWGAPVVAALTVAAARWHPGRAGVDRRTG